MARCKNESALDFDGEKRDVESFLRAFNYESLKYRWNTDYQAKAIKFCLSGKALRYYNELSAAEKLDIEVVKKKLTDCLSVAPEYYMGQFFTRSLNPNETISSFCHAIQTLLERGMPSLDDDTKTKMLRAKLIPVVPSYVKNFLEMFPEKSWDQIVLIFDRSTDFKSIVPDVDVNRMGTSPDRRVESATNFRQDPGKFYAACYYCRKIGHRQNSCHKRLADMQLSQNRFG